MIEIKNPHSRKRLTLKEKFDKKFTEFMIPHIKKIPLDKNWKITSKYIPEVLKSARISVQGWERDKSWTNEIPQDVELDLLSVYVAEYIPIENVDKLNKGLKKLMKKYPVWHQHGQADRIDEFCNEVKQSIHGGRWSNFGYINLGKEDKISAFVENVHIHATHISSSSIILQFIITPSEKFSNEFKKIIESDIKEDKSFNLTFKNLFKFWGGGSLSPAIIKNQMLEDYIIELKWRTMREVSKYFDLYFTNSKLIPPSIEVYKLNQKACSLERKEDEKKNEFWRSVGMDSDFSDISKDGYWSLFPEERGSHFINNSLKVTCNSELEKHDMFHSLEFQIVYLLEEFANNLLPVMVMREYANYTSKKVAIQQNKTFSSIKKQNPRYRRLINIRYELEQNLQILKRFKNEIGENYFDTVKAQIKKLADFEPRYGNMSATELIVDNTNYIIDKTHNHSKHFAKMIDDTVRLLEIKTNNSTRLRSFWLSIISVVLSIISVVISITATTFAGLSLFYQLSVENQNKVADFFNPIIKFFKDLF